MNKHEEYLWKDPFDLASCGPVLLSDQIRSLAEEMGLIEPFDATSLRPASYDLRVGDSYYVGDDRKELTAETNKIEIPSNGLVYIRTKEKFNIPYYLVARYSLRVQQVYRGLLIDNGLHIDPGYCGPIWIPVHNFTMQPRILLRGDEFISVEFNRTTRLPGEVYTMKSEEELVSRAIANELVGSHGRPIKVFYRDLDHYQQRHAEITPHYFWNKFRGEKHESAMLGTEQRLDKVKADVEAEVTKFRDETQRRLDSLRNFGLVAFAGALIGILGIVLGITLPFMFNQFEKSRQMEAQHTSEINDLRERLREQRNRLDAVTPQSAPASGLAAPPRPKGK